MKKDNRGLSLIELIVTVAIMVVLVGVGVIGVGFLSPRAAKQTGENLKLTFENARLDALSKKNMTLTIWADSEGVHYEEQVDVGGTSTVKEGLLGKKSVKVQLRNAADDTLTDLGTTKSTGAVFTFKRGTGGFDTMSPFEIKEILISKGTTTYTLALQKYTGKVIVK